MRRGHAIAMVLLAVSAGMAGVCPAGAAAAAAPAAAACRPLAAGNFQSAAAPPEARLRSDLDYRRGVDIPILVGAAGAWVLSEALKADLAPADCRWCDRDAQGNDRLNGLDAWVRRRLRTSSTSGLTTASDVTDFVLAPLATVGVNALLARRAGCSGQVAPDAVIVLEAGALAADLAQVVKFTTGRARPFVHDLAPAARAATAHPADNNTSFYSGHTSTAFALAVAAGRVASMRGYHGERWVWAGGLTVATATGLLRIAADRHYATDVLAGAATGVVVGWAATRWWHQGAWESDGAGPGGR